MTLSADTYEVAAIAVAVAVLAVAAVTIPLLLQIRRTVRAAEELYTEAKVTAELLNGILRKSGEEIGDIAELIRKVKDLGLKITGITDTVVDSVKGPVLTIASLILGLKGGLRHFIEKKGTEEQKEQTKEHPEENPQ